MERSLFNLFHKLLDTNVTSSRIIFAAGIGQQTIREIILALGGQRLASTSELVSLMDSAKKATTKRNHIIHGVWQLNITIDRDKRTQKETARTATWVRFYEPTDPEVFKKMQDAKLRQKLQAAHEFLLPRLIALAHEASALAKKIDAFCEKMTLLPPRHAQPVKHF